MDEAEIRELVARELIRAMHAHLRKEDDAEPSVRLVLAEANGILAELRLPREEEPR